MERPLGVRSSRGSRSRGLIGRVQLPSLKGVTRGVYGGIRGIGGYNGIYMDKRGIKVYIEYINI